MTKERREDLQTYSSWFMLICGVVFGWAGFIVDPVGQIHDSVLWIAAQCFIYAGSAMGLSTYVHGKFNDIRRDLKLKNDGVETEKDAMP